MFLFKRLPSITSRELEHKISQREPLEIIDVRETNEFAGGHIPGAKNVPLRKIKKYQSNKKVYVICQSGARSRRAVKELKQNGVDAVNVKGGMMGWRGKTRGGKL
ncbi:rhodanese-like domain-containing protein [Vagococcus acidifermentans]|uniref:Sulfurtransferase n=1 Tax=Vagococcus acidifermentans TaxID=564710 RepID=A0A430B0U0_9ENTE|nr:rhodanese-like domain-containing protein [Vagococcus acidifermentans]RSU13919.1 sulfurtransferase [Vagococcus acidifermentans]